MGITGTIERWVQNYKELPEKMKQTCIRKL